MPFWCYGKEKVKTENQIARRGTPFSFYIRFLLKIFQNQIKFFLRQIWIINPF